MFRYIFNKIDSIPICKRKLSIFSGNETHRISRYFSVKYLFFSTHKTAVDELTAEEREAVTIVFHQFETGLREGTIFTKVEIEAQILLCPVSTEFKQDSWGRYTLFPSQFAFKSTDEHHFSWIGHVVNTPIRDGG